MGWYLFQENLNRNKNMNKWLTVCEQNQNPPILLKKMEICNF